MKILFVCHGNICRSPMAEFVMKDMLDCQGIADIVVDSAATSAEELGNPVHPGTAKILRRLGIDFTAKRARKIEKGDYDKYDLLIGMDSRNIRNMNRFWDDSGHKIQRLLDYCGGGDISDPWYTGDFEKTFTDIQKGCTSLITFLKSNQQRKNLFCLD